MAEKCTKCGSTNTKIIENRSELNILTSTFTIDIDYKCNDCKHKWTDLDYENPGTEHSKYGF